MLDMYRLRYVSVQYSIHIEHACFRNHFLQLSAMVAFPQLHPWCTAAAASFFTRKEPATLAASSNSQAWPCGLTCTTCWTGSDALVSLSCLGWSFGQRENWTWLWQRFTTPHSHNQLIYINLYFPKIWSIVSYHPCHPYEYHPIKGTFWGHLPRCHPAWCLAPLFSQTSGGHHGKRAQVKSTSKMRWFTAAKITKTSTNPEKSLVINETIGLLFPDLVMVYAPKKTSQSPKDHPARCREGCADADGIRRRGKVLHLLGCGVSLVNEPARVDFLLVWNLISSYIIL